MLRGAGAAVLALTLALAGCGGGVGALGRVERPAAVPLRAFPEIVIVASDRAFEARLAERLAAHLGDGPSRVRRLASREALARARAGERLGRVSVVLELGLALVEREPPTWPARDTLDCGPGGCVEVRRPMVDETPRVSGRLELRVSDGPTGRPLQRMAIEEEAAGVDLEGARQNLFARLAERAVDLVDPDVEEVRVELIGGGAPGAREALERAARGDWAGARRRLERVATSGQVRALSAQERARVLHDLGLARRFDVSLPVERRFALAAEALRDAVRLDPLPRYAEALRALREHRRRRALWREQEEATRHNFALAGPPSP